MYYFSRNSEEYVNTHIKQSSNNSYSNNMPNISPHTSGKSGRNAEKKNKGSLVFESSRHPADREDFEATGNETYVPASKGRKSNNYL